MQNFNIFADAKAKTNANADAGDSTIALPECCSGELKMTGKYFTQLADSRCDR